MPIYEYKCLRCEAHEEVLQKVSDKPLKKCKKCGGRLEKQWSQTGFQFKGTGWYVTDYAGKGKDQKGDESSSSTDSKSDSSDSKDAKSETKADAKSETKSETAKSGGEKKTPKATGTSKGKSKD